MSTVHATERRDAITIRLEWEEAMRLARILGRPALENPVVWRFYTQLRRELSDPGDVEGAAI